MSRRFLSLWIVLAIVFCGYAIIVLYSRKDALPDDVAPPLRGAASEVRVRARHAVPGVSAVPEGPASDFIRTVCGLDAASANRYEARNDALRSIARRRDLPKEDVAALMAYLRSKDSAMRVERVAALKNDVMNLLRNQDPPAECLAETLIVMFRSGKHPPVVLDYCIQHLGAMQNEITDDALRRRIREIFVFGFGRDRDKRYSLERYSQVAFEWRRPFCIRAFMATLPR